MLSLAHIKKWQIEYNKLWIIFHIYIYVFIYIRDIPIGGMNWMGMNKIYYIHGWCYQKIILIIKNWKLILLRITSRNSFKCFKIYLSYFMSRCVLATCVSVCYV